MSTEASRWVETPEDFSNYEEEPVVNQEDQAEDHLRFLEYWRQQLEEKERHAQQEIARVQDWLEEERARIGKKIAWHEQGLTGFLWHTRQKSIKLINGSIQRIKGRERITIPDEEAFLSQALPEFISEKIVRKPDKKAIMGHIKETGEIPSGVDLERNEDSVQIKTTGG